MAVLRVAPTTRWVDDPRVKAVLDHGSRLYLAVPSRWGPHVTPQVFERKGRRLWALVERGSFKAKAIGRRAGVGGMVRHQDRTAVVLGRARILDPVTTRGLWSRSRLFDLPVAMAGYVDRNYRHAVGVVRDRPTPTLPLSRVVVTVEVTAVALLDGLTLVAAWGEWADRDLLLRDAALPAPRPPQLHGVPTSVRRVVADASAEPVLGWQSLSGLLVLPARGRIDAGEILTSLDAMVLAGATPRGPAGVTVETGHHRLHSKRGLMVRGVGTARARGTAARVVVEPERVTYWSGDRTGTLVRRPHRPA